MVKFINIRKVVLEIEEFIKNVGEKFIFVLFYLKLFKDFRELLVYCNSKDKIIIVIFGK